MLQRAPPRRLPARAVPMRAPCLRRPQRPHHSPQMHRPPWRSTTSKVEPEPSAAPESCADGPAASPEAPEALHLAETPARAPPPEATRVKPRPAMHAGVSRPARPHRPAAVPHPPTTRPPRSPPAAQLRKHLGDAALALPGTRRQPLDSPHGVSEAPGQRPRPEAPPVVPRPRQQRREARVHRPRPRRAAPARHPAPDCRRRSELAEGRGALRPQGRSSRP